MHEPSESFPIGMSASYPKRSRLSARVTGV